MKKLKKPILAEGEISGHAHKLPDFVEVFETDNKTRVFDIKKPVKVEHEEHRAIELPAGQHESDRVSEYDHFAEEARKVQD